MKILRAIGLLETIVALIQKMYSGTLAKVITSDGLTDVFGILAGVLQGESGHVSAIPIYQCGRLRHADSVTGRER